MGFLSPLNIEELVAVVKLIFYAGIGNLVTEISISFKKVHISSRCASVEYDRENKLRFNRVIKELGS
jgi:hypothetical protein